MPTKYFGHTPTEANADLDALPSALQQLPGRTVATLSDYVANNAVFNIKDFGAKGDGATDDTAARDLALVEARAAGGVLYHPRGNFKYTTPLHVQASDRITAAGRPNTILNFVGCDGIVKDPGVSTADYVELSGFTVQAGTNAGTSIYKCLDSTNMSYSTFEKLALQFGLMGINVTRGAAAAACFFNTYQNIRAQYCKTGLSMLNVATAVCTSHKFRDVHVEDVGVWGSASVGFDIEGYGHRFSDCYAGGMTSRELRINTISGDNWWFGLYLESNPVIAIDVPNGTSGRLGNKIFGVHFDGTPGTKINDPFGELFVMQDDGSTTGTSEIRQASGNLTVLGDSNPHTIFTFQSATRPGGLLLVQGVTSAGDAFTDLLLCGGGTGTVTVVASKAAAAPARTYTISGAAVRLAININVNNLHAIVQGLSGF